MERQYRILSSQSAAEQSRVIYCLLTGKEKSVRIVIERRLGWEVGMTVQLEESFVEANREID